MTTDDIRKELNQIDEQTHRKLVHYIQTRCCPEDIAEECVQYAYLQALVQAKKIRRSDRLFMAYHGGETERMEGDEAKKKADVRRNWRGRI